MEWESLVRSTTRPLRLDPACLHAEPNNPLTEDRWKLLLRVFDAATKPSPFNALNAIPETSRGSSADRGVHWNLQLRFMGDAGGAAATKALMACADAGVLTPGDHSYDPLRRIAIRAGLPEGKTLEAVVRAAVWVNSPTESLEYAAAHERVPLRNHVMKVFEAEARGTRLGAISSII